MSFLKKRKRSSAAVSCVQTHSSGHHPFDSMRHYIPLRTPETRLYESMREAIPVIDAALYKIQRLLGGFVLRCDNAQAEKQLNAFMKQVRVGASTCGLEKFICEYLDSLLLYGNAVGEVVLSPDNRQVLGLYNASFDDVVVKEGKNPLEVEIFRLTPTGEAVAVVKPQLVLFTAFNPPPAKVCGESILKSLPFVSSILLKIYNSIGLNFDRVGNVRFAVTYKPSGDAVDKAYAKEHAMQIAHEWSDGMAAGKNGEIKDFVAVGDVDIKVIGADNQMIDCEVPARQMLEQIVAKLSLPPFMLGLSWSTTERMSQQQADVLSNEISYFRRLLAPVIEKVCTIYLRVNGYTCAPLIEWDVLSFEDEMDAAQARLYNAQAAKLELECGFEPKRVPVDVSAQKKRRE